jgi:hypothetical protein
VPEAIGVTFTSGAVGEPEILTTGMFIWGILGVEVTGAQATNKPANKKAKKTGVICVRN